MHLGKALCFTVRTESLAATEALLNDGADVNFCDDKGKTPLYYACQFGNIAQIKLLCERGANLKRKYDGETLMAVAVEQCWDNLVEIVDILRRCGGTFGKEFKLSHYYDDNYVDFMAWMISDLGMGANLNEGSRTSKMTLLHFACGHGQEKMVRFLIDHGANINAISKFGCTPLFYAVFHKQVAIVEMLLANKAVLVNVQDAEGNTPLHVACLRGNLEIVCLLSRNGADMTIKNRKGKRACDLNIKKNVRVARSRPVSLTNEIVQVAHVPRFRLVSLTNEIVERDLRQFPPALNYQIWNGTNGVWSKPYDLSKDFKGLCDYGCPEKTRCHINEAGAIVRFGALMGPDGLIRELYDSDK